MPKVNVFVSSTMLELGVERKALFDLIPELSDDTIKLHPWVFEFNAPAADKSVRETYLEVLRDSELYIGIFWNRYGEWTIDEFDRATQWGIDRHIYVKNVDADERDERLEAFLNKCSDVTSGITAKWFTTLDELRQSVSQSTSEWIKQRERGRASSGMGIRVAVASEIPHLPRVFVGYSDLMHEAFGFLSSSRSVLLQGLGGIGKTAFAAELVSEWLRQKKGHVLWLQAGNLDADELAEALATDPENRREILSAQGTARVQAIRKWLARSEIGLVVLDGAWNGSAIHYMTQVLPSTVSLLVTSRQRFGLEEIISLPKIADDAALKLLQFHCGTETEEAEATRLCEILGNLPFALEIAGRTMRMKQWSAADLLAKIGNTAHRMQVPLDFSDEDRRHVADLLETSLFALGEAERRVFLAIGSFFQPTVTPALLAWLMSPPKSKDFTVKDAEKIFANMLQEAEHVVLSVSDFIYETYKTPMLEAESVAAATKALDTLVEYGLAEFVPDTRLVSAHYTIHELSYSYASAQTTEGKQQEVLTALINYAEHNDKKSERDFAALNAVVENFVHGTRWAFESERYDIVMALTTYLMPYFGFQGLHQYAIELATRALQASTAVNSRRAQGFIDYLGTTYMNLGQYEKALEYQQQALSLAQASNNSAAEQRTLNNLAITYKNRFEFDKAVEIFNHSLNLARDAGDLAAEAGILNSLGNILQYQEQYSQAIEFHQRALDAARRLGERSLQGMSLGNLGNDYFALKQYKQAEIMNVQSLDLLDVVGDRVALSRGYRIQGNIYLEQAKYGSAQEYFRRSLEISRELGNSKLEAETLLHFGLMWMRQGRVNEAKRYLGDALKKAQEGDDLIIRALCCKNLGRIAFTEGSYDDAGRYMEDALSLFSERAVHGNISECLLALGEARQAQRRHDEAIDYYIRCLVLVQEIGDLGTEAGVRIKLASTYDEMGDFDQSIDHLERAKDILEKLDLKNSLHMVKQLIIQSESRRSKLEQSGKAETAGEAGRLTNAPELQCPSCKRSVSTQEYEGLRGYVTGVRIECPHCTSILYINFRDNTVELETTLSTIAISGSENAHSNELQHAYQLGANGQYEEALARFSDVIAFDPDSAQAFAGRGLAYSSLNRIREAMEDFFQCLALDPDNVDAHIGLGTTFFDKMFIPELAIFYFEKAVQLGVPMAAEYAMRTRQMLARSPEWQAGQHAFEAFLNVSSLEEMERATQHHPIMREPLFLYHTRKLMDKMPPSFRSSFEARLAMLSRFQDDNRSTSKSKQDSITLLHRFRRFLSVLLQGKH